MAWKTFAAAMLVIALSGAGAARAASAEECRPASAITTTVAAVAGDPEAWMGKCVTVTAVGSRAWLYESVDGFYRPEGALVDPTSNGLRLGLDNMRPLRPGAGFPRLTVTGRVQDCEAVRGAVEGSAAPGEIYMVAGYCHYFNGVYLWVKTARRGPSAPFERQLVARGEDYGDLVVATPNWRHRPVLEEKAGAFLNAAVARDRQALVNLIAPDPTDETDVEEARKEVARVLRGASVFRGLAPTSQTLILRERGEEGDDRSPQGYACFCRAADCGGRWPIASFDIDNLPSRPYACIHITDYVVYRKGKRTVVILPEVEVGLKEPAQAASAPRS